MTDIEKLNAEIARLTAERDALENPPMSEAERWARAFQDELRRHNRDGWSDFERLGTPIQADLIAAMQPVIDGIRSEADCALASMTAQRDRLKLKVDSQRDELKRWNDAHSMGPNQTRDKLVEQAHEIQTMTAELARVTKERDALRNELARTKRMLTESEQDRIPLQKCVEEIRDCLGEEAKDPSITLAGTIEAILDQRDALKTELESCSCAYCGESISNGGPEDLEKIQAHIFVCPSHPLAAVTAERDALKTQVDALATRAAGLESERDALAARVQRGGVEFDVDDGEFRRWMEANTSMSLHDHEARDIKSYLAEHATVVRQETQSAKFIQEMQAAQEATRNHNSGPFGGHLDNIEELPKASRERWRAGGVGGGGGGGVVVGGGGGHQPDSH